MRIAFTLADHSTVSIARDDKVMNIRTIPASAFQYRHSFWTVAGAREGNPKILRAGNHPVVHVGEQIRARNREHLATPRLTKKECKRLTDIVRRAGADEENGWLDAGTCTDPCGRQEFRDLVALSLKEFQSRQPRIGLLGNFRGRMNQPASRFLTVRQTQ